MFHFFILKKKYINILTVIKESKLVLRRKLIKTGFRTICILLTIINAKHQISKIINGRRKKYLLNYFMDEFIQKSIHNLSFINWHRYYDLKNKLCSERFLNITIDALNKTKPTIQGYLSKYVISLIHKIKLSVSKK